LKVLGVPASNASRQTVPRHRRRNRALKHGYPCVADPARVRDPNRKGTVEHAIQHTQNTALKGRKFDTIEQQNEHLEQWEQRWAGPAHPWPRETPGAGHVRGGAIFVDSLATAALCLLQGSHSHGMRRHHGAGGQQQLRSRPRPARGAEPGTKIAVLTKRLARHSDPLRSFRQPNEMELQHQLGWRFLTGHFRSV